MKGILIHDAQIDMRTYEAASRHAHDEAEERDKFFIARQLEATGCRDVNAVVVEAAPCLVTRAWQRFRGEAYNLITRGLRREVVLEQTKRV